MDKIGIRQAVNCGYIECKIPGVADFSYPTSKLRRGRVQGGEKYLPQLQQRQECVRSSNGQENQADRDNRYGR